MYLPMYYVSPYVDAFDFQLLVETLEKLKEGKNVQIPIYDFTTHSRSKAHVRKPVVFFIDTLDL